MVRVRVRLSTILSLYSKTNQMHQSIKLFYFGMTLYMSAWQQTDSCICLTNVCCCMYSLELLMADGETVRNM